MSSSKKHIEGLALVQALIESGVAEKIGEGCYRWKGGSREEAIETYLAWEKANPDRAARFEQLNSASEDLPEA